ncbi:MAG: methyltransferase domain-containing protein, partial [Alphaproteobacteria bacterium]
ALPLAARGLRLAGIEASPLMVEKMRAKPGGADIPVVIGDMATAKMEGRFDLVFLIFNTLFNLTTRTAQQDCFCNAAAHLNPGGLFVIETVMPDTAEFVHGQRLRIRKRTKDCQVLEAAIHDPDNQRIDYQYIRMEGEGVEITPLPIRYASPQEIDEMAASAGFALTQRWGGWRRAPFASESDMHISVYRTA